MVFNFERGAADCGERGEAAGAFASLKNRPTEFCASAGLSLLMRGLDYFFSVASPPPRRVSRRSWRPVRRA
jgi:hypothetical protein